MALCTVRFFSESLQLSTAMYVILPDGRFKPPYAVLYQLHGLSDDYTIWLRRTSIERYVANVPLVVVMPDGGRGWYTDAVEGYAYESHIMKDTMGFVERFFPVKRARAGRAVGGLSMGGYGAMKLALKHPGIFASVASHSSAFDSGHKPSESEHKEVVRVFGANPEGGPNDVFALAGKLNPKAAPAIWIDCGTSDRLLDSNRRFHRRLAKLGVRHTYREYPGIHEWDYWDAHFPDALKFHARNLGFKAQK